MTDQRRRLLLQGGALFAVGTLVSGCSTFGPRRPRRVGFLTGDLPEIISAFRAELASLGYFEGQNLELEIRTVAAAGSDNAALAADLLATDPDLVVAASLPLALAVQAADPRMPIVVATGPGLVSNGLAESLERPGGLVTGMDELPAGLTRRRLELLKTAAPAVTRVALLSTTPGTGGHEIQLADAEQAAPDLGIAVQPYRVTSVDQLDATFSAIVADGMDGLLSFQGALALANRVTIVEFAAQNRLPAIYQATLFAEAGGLMAWAPDLNEQFREAARTADKILDGARPGDLPITQPQRYYLTVNTTAAERIGLTLPAALLSQADRVLS